MSTPYSSDKTAALLAFYDSVNTGYLEDFKYQLRQCEAERARLEKEVARIMEGHSKTYDAWAVDQAKLQAKFDRVHGQLQALVTANALDTLTSRKFLMAEQALAEVDSSP